VLSWLDEEKQDRWEEAVDFIYFMLSNCKYAVNKFTRKSRK